MAAKLIINHDLQSCAVENNVDYTILVIAYWFASVD